MKHHHPEDPIPPLTVQEAIGDFLAARQPLVSSDTMHIYRAALLRFLRFLEADYGEAFPLQGVTPRLVTTYLLSLQQEGLAPTSQRGYMTILKIWLRWCEEDEDYASAVSPRLVSRVPIPKASPRIVEAFSPAQVKALLAATQQGQNAFVCDRDKTLILLLLDTGLRASEICRLNLADLHLEAPQDSYLIVLGKGGAWGESPLSTQARRALRRYLRHWRLPRLEQMTREQAGETASTHQMARIREGLAKNFPVFVTNSQRRRLTRRGLWEIVRRLGKRAGLLNERRCSPHTFRHTFSQLFMREDEEGNRGDIYELQQRLRHHSIVTTERYLRSLRKSELRRSHRSPLDRLDL